MDAIQPRGRDSAPRRSPRPDEQDVHLSVFLHGIRFDFAACLTAALLFIQEHQAQHYADAVTVDLGDASAFPRLPNERLYLEP
ncbi:hypothetical protein [Nocardia sp. NPDC004604]|uniref:hypothetical protein n=1 Tax=Nocardia sp. NPDC004604 TaxID=3157013 RepID=UPI0033AB1EF0